MKKWVLLGLALLAGGAARAAIVEGRDYERLANPQPVADQKKIEVIEFFSYHCIHCYKLDPLIAKWETTKPKDVDFRKEQIVWQDEMKGFARFFATEKNLGLSSKLHTPAFKAVIEQRINIADEAQLVPWLKRQPGVDVAKFMGVYKSFAVNAEAERAKKITLDYQVMATPVIVVNGKYAIKGGESPDTLRVLNELIAKIRSERK